MILLTLMDYHRILPKLFIGSYPESAEDIERLKREAGVTAVLNLQTDDDMRYFKLDWDSLLHHYKSCGIELRRVPVRDFDAVDLRRKLPASVSTFNDLLESGHTVYLHCSAGAGLGLRPSRRSCHTVPALFAQCRSDRLASVAR